MLALESRCKSTTMGLRFTNGCENIFLDGWLLAVCNFVVCASALVFWGMEVAGQRISAGGRIEGVTVLQLLQLKIRE